MKNLLLLLFICPTILFGQNYTSYFVGNSTNIVTEAKGGVCLMGGASEHDNAMRWFLEQANGGDVLVLRTSGADGYNDYMLNQLGVSVNSVETIVCNNASASQDSYIHDKIKQAEAIWFAGGDQWVYISYWRNTPVDSLINKGIAERNVVVGGTSAGMAIQGHYYFSAENGTVTSNAALNDPFNSSVTISDQKFLVNEHLHDVITDTHYDNPDRRGRHVTFLGRIITDHQVIGKGIACEEYTAVCIDSNGLCKIYGEYPAYDEDIYFIQPNCELSNQTPETCIASTPLTWNRSGQALKVYHAKGTLNGDQTFDLTDWKTGTGGVWEHWSVDNGVLTINPGTAPTCTSNTLQEFGNTEIAVFPNPVTDGKVTISSHEDYNIRLTDLNGKEERVIIINHQLDLNHLKNGVYFLHLSKGQETNTLKLVIAY